MWGIYNEKKTLGSLRPLSQWRQIEQTTGTLFCYGLSSGTRSSLKLGSVRSSLTLRPECAGPCRPRTCLPTHLSLLSLPLTSSLASGLVSSPQPLHPSQPLSCRLVCQMQALVSLRPRRNAYSKGLSLPPPFMTRHSLSSRPSPHRLVSRTSSHRIPQLPPYAQLAPLQLSRGHSPLVRVAPRRPHLPAFVGLALSRANAIGVEGSPGSVTAHPVLSSLSPFVYLSSGMTPFPPPSCHRPVVILTASTHTIQTATRRHDHRCI